MAIEFFPTSNAAYYKTVLQEGVIDCVHGKLKAIFLETVALTTWDGTKHNLSTH